MRMSSRASGPAALAIALLALLVAVSGTSYAAVKLSRGSVTTATIRDQAVTSAKVKDGTITSTDVRDRSLLARDFRAGQLPAGRTGPQGVPGVRGPQGVPGVQGERGEKGENGDAVSGVVTFYDQADVEPSHDIALQFLLGKELQSSATHLAGERFMDATGTFTKDGTYRVTYHVGVRTEEAEGVDVVMNARLGGAWVTEGASWLTVRPGRDVLDRTFVVRATAGQRLEVLGATTDPGTAFVTGWQMDVEKLL
jgi:hypothetical protein